MWSLVGFWELRLGSNLFSIFPNDLNEDMPVKYLEDIEIGICNITNKIRLKSLDKI